VGAILGALASSLILISWLGTQEGQRLLIALSALGALFMLVRYFWPLRRNGLSGRRFDRPVRRLAEAALLLAAMTMAGAMAWSVPGVPWELVAYGRTIASYTDPWKKLYVGEGMNSSVAVTELDNGVRNFHVSGKIEASSEPEDMRLQRMLGHIPALVHSKPRSVLIVGCGAGVTLGTFVVHPD